MNIDKYYISYKKGSHVVMTQDAPTSAMWVPPVGTVINFVGQKEVVSLVEYFPLSAEIIVHLAR